jgi:hypothetical protein
VDSVEALVVVDEVEEEVVDLEDVDVVVPEEDEAKMRRSGFLLPNSVASSRKARSRVWRKSTSSPFPSRNMKSLTSSWDLL